MASRFRRYGLSAAVLLILILGQPMRGETQCSVIGTSMFTSPTFIFRAKTLNVSVFCIVTMSMNVKLCDHVTGATTNFLPASASPLAMSPSCAWQCNCGPGTATQKFTITGADGLPVELLDFKVTSVPQPPSFAEELPKSRPSLTHPRATSGG